MNLRQKALAEKKNIRDILLEEKIVKAELANRHLTYITLDEEQSVFDSIFDIFFEEGGLFGFINGWNMSIIFFLFALGVMTSFMVMSGGTKALTEYLSEKIKTRKGNIYGN